MKSHLRKIIPKPLINQYHYGLSALAVRKYNYPSDKLFVIGVTGTSGKSSVISFLRQVLESAGFRVGSLSTVDFYIAGEKQLNDQKMTMLGRAMTQEYLQKMVDAKCDIAIVETTSEGAVQFRHRHINYDIMVLTNLYPEHIDSHGSFENYKGAKLSIFKHVANCKHKNVTDLVGDKITLLLTEKIIPKQAVVNADIEWTDEFIDYPFDKTFVFSRNDEVLHVEKQKLDYETNLVLGKNIDHTKDGLAFDWNGYHVTAPLFGEYNVMNLLSLIGVAHAMGITPETIIKGITTVTGAEGRLEFIKESEPHGFQVIVDYAFEPVAIEELYKVVCLLQPERIIHVFGSTGGGRDVSRRSSVGTFVGNHADICIVTDEDPYDDDPMEIINDVADAVRTTGKEDGKNLFIELSRKQAIAMAIDMARKGDMILVTGKGSEQGMVIANREIVPWDDRKEVRAAISTKA